MIRKATVLLLCLMPLVGVGQIYQWRDSAGNLHFSDKPTRGAKKIQLNDVKTVPSTAPKEVPRMTLKPNVPEPKKNYTYQRVAITLPKPHETIRNNIGLIDVSVDVQPALANGDKLVLFIDGQRAGESTSSSQFTLHDVYRGTHYLQAKVISKEGKVVGSSERVPVHVHRARVSQNRKSQLLNASAAQMAGGTMNDLIIQMRQQELADKQRS